MPELIHELLQQPETLLRLLDYYQEGNNRSLLDLPEPTYPLLIGMGASFHAAWIGSSLLQHIGLISSALEATDALHYGSCLLHKTDHLIYISQSGCSGEVQPILDFVEDGGVNLVGITNQTESPLAAHARVVLPMMAGEEEWIASKTYINSLALVWLLAQGWTGQNLETSFSTLRELTYQMREVQKESLNAIDRLSETFRLSERVIFLGHGPHAATAREAAMTLAEWPKLTSLSFGVGAFRHGFIETADEHTSAVIFAPPGRTCQSALALGYELANNGVKVLFIENGRLRGLQDQPHPAPILDEYLSPILDILPIQLFAENSARLRFETPGFRYISKIVKKL